MNIVIDAETLGLDHFHPDFKVLFNGFLEDNIIYQVPGYINLSNDYDILTGHNLKFDLKCLLQQNFNFPKCKLYDTQVAVHLLREDLNSYALEELARIFYRYPNYKNLVDFENTPYWEELETLKLYNKHDLIFTDQLQKWTEPLLKKQNKWNLFCMTMDFVKALTEMEMRGIKFDEEELNRQGAILQIREQKLVEELRNYAPIDWSGGTTDEIRHYFDTHHEIPKSQKSKKPKLDEGILKSLDCPEAKLLLELRAVQKQLHTYVEGIKSRIHNGLYYADYALTNTVTTRLSEHFIQLIPRKETSDFKKCIVSRFPGGKLLEIDWSQLEARLQAELIWALTGKHQFADDLVGGKDIHSETLKRFPFLPDRTRAKNANFSVIFGGKGWSLVNEYGFTWDQAREFTKDLTEVRYPEFGELFRMIENLVNIKGIVEHPYTHYTRHTRNYNEGLNNPIQHLGTVFNKIQMIQVNKALKDFESKPIMEVHDSIVIDVKPEEEYEVIECIKRQYNNFPLYFDSYFKQSLKIPYSAEMKIGSNLYEQEKIK